VAKNVKTATCSSGVSALVEATSRVKPARSLRVQRKKRKAKLKHIRDREKNETSGKTYIEPKAISFRRGCRTCCRSWLSVIEEELSRLELVGLPLFSSVVSLEEDGEEGEDEDEEEEVLTSAARTRFTSSFPQAARARNKSSYGSRNQPHRIIAIQERKRGRGKGD
jgi:hypothetical protein